MNIKLIIITIFIIFLIPIITWIDYLVLGKWARCNKCGYKIEEWYAFIMPTILEMFMFCVGLILGLGLK